MKMQVTTPSPTFKPITVELTFETLEELLVLTHTIGGWFSTDVSKSIKAIRGIDVLDDRCSDISIEQYNFFSSILTEVVPRKV